MALITYFSALGSFFKLFSAPGIGYIIWFEFWLVHLRYLLCLLWLVTCDWSQRTFQPIPLYLVSKSQCGDTAGMPCQFGSRTRDLNLKKIFSEWIASWESLGRLERQVYLNKTASPAIDQQAFHLKRETMHYSTHSYIVQIWSLCTPYLLYEHNRYLSDINFVRRGDLTERFICLKLNRKLCIAIQVVNN